MVFLLPLLILFAAGCHGDPGPGPADGGGDAGDASHSAMPPMASAGPDISVVRGQIAMLSGGGSMSRCGADLSYQWHQLGGRETPLSNYSSPAPSFIAPLDPGEIDFQLVVTDRCGSDSDFVTIRVGAQIWPTLTTPVASAGGDFSLPPGWSGQLKGSGSLWFQEGSKDYLWRTSPAGLITAGDTSQTPQVLIPGDLLLGMAHLETRANINWSAPDQAVLLIDPGIVQPVATIPPAVTNDIEYVLPSQQTVNLTGVPPASDYDDFLWRQVQGTPVQIRQPTSVATSFPAPERADTLVFALKGRKGALWSAPAFKTVYVWGGSTTPHAVAGDDASADPDSTAQLDGSKSTVDATRIKDKKFKWVQTAGDPVILDDPASVAPRFTTPDRAGRLCFMLTVSDGVVTSQPDSVVVTVDEP
jgi:hypothetical protein